MKPRPLLILISILLFILGTGFSLYFSSNFLWGEMEALIFTPQTGDRKLSIDCPLMISPSETATISTSIINTTAKDTKPQVNAFFSYQNDVEVNTQTLELGAYASQPLQWTVDSSNLVFDRLILVSILQRPYRDLESRQSTCSIYVFSLFGLSGKNSLITLIGFSTLASFLGIAMMNYFLKPFSERLKKIMQVNTVFHVLVLLGLFSSLPRLWGLTLFFNATAFLAITVAYVEILFSKK